MSARTPGPWAWNTSTDIYEKDTGFTVIEIANKPKIEDARLIAAAPELLEALEMLMPLEPSRYESESYGRDMWQNASDAIAKATGKEPA